MWKRVLKNQIENIDKTIRAAFAYLNEYRLEYARALCVPVLISSLVGVNFPENLEGMGAIFYALSVLVMIMFYFLIAIVTHRITLLGSESVTRWGIYIPGNRELYFIFYSIGLVLIMIPVAVLAMIPTIGIFLFYGAFGYLSARLSLVLPAITIDDKYSFKDSWNATKDHQLFILAIVWVLPTIIFLPLELFDSIPNIELVISFLATIITIFTIVMLSIAFRIIDEK